LGQFALELTIWGMLAGKTAKEGQGKPHPTTSHVGGERPWIQMAIFSKGRL
jgi:hypothetical protein